MKSKIVDSIIISLIILIPLLIVTHHLLGACFNLIFRYNQLAELYLMKIEIDRSITGVYWFGFNVIDRVSQTIMLDTILYIILGLFFVLSVLVYVFYVKPTNEKK